ncbi:MAG: HNH endonuclease [Planctomycetes bacterium]|nr:HNH endonuclease [Planctomycetota bacterium]
MADISRKPPLPVKRQLRQEALFGCCCCGNPIIQYHHIIPFAELKHHDLKHMMCVCPLCHDKITAGAMPESEQRAAKARPYNMSHEFVEGQLVINSKQLVVNLAGNWFFGSGLKLAVDNKPLLELSEDDRGRLQLSVELYDEHDQLLALIERNSWISGDPAAWDIEFRYQWLRIRAKSHRISLTVDVGVEPVKLSGRLWRAGRDFRITEQQLTIDSRGLNNSYENLGFAFLGFNVNSISRKASIVADRIQGEGKFFAWPNTCSDRIEYGLKFCEQIRANSLLSQKNK